MEITMYKLIAGVLSILVFTPVALFSNQVFAANNTLNETAADVVAVPAEPISHEDLAQPEQEPVLAEQDLTVQAEAPSVQVEDPTEAETKLTELENSIDEAFQAFVEQVTTGQTETITGIYVDEDFAMDVVQQPQNNPGYISSTDGELTDFRLARDYGTIGMLAHNYLAGQHFDELEVGDTIYLVYGDSHYVTYSITNVESYQALTPNSPYSAFVSLDDPNVQLSAENLFYQVYGQEDALVLQTCIEKDGELSWGRLFITAEPNYSLADLPAAVDSQ